MDFTQLVEKRRAVNFFDPTKDVPEDLLKKIIEMAAKSPSSFNLQPWNLIVLRDKEDKLRLQKHAMDQPKVSEAPVTLIVLADRNGWKEGHKTVEDLFQENVRAGIMVEEQRDWFKDTRGSLYGRNEETAQAFANKNTGFFAMTLMFAAKSLGVDTHPMDGFDHDAIRKEFNIPDNFWIPLLIAVGHFDEEKTLDPPKWRKHVEDIIVNFENT